MTRSLAALIVLLLFPLQAWGQAARITSGDHSDFTRIVVEYPGAVDWKMGRTADGYELRLPQGGMQYDLTKAFDLIKKDRLAAIFADPKTGGLRLGIACACFAIPFEFRPGTVVIDIRDGDPPNGSEFELALDGGTSPAPQPLAQTPKQVYDWTAAALEPAKQPAAQDQVSPLFTVANPPAAAVDLQPLRQSLIKQLSKGATAGIVDMAKPKGDTPVTGEAQDTASVQLRLGDELNLELRQLGESGTPVTASGAACFSDEQLDVGAWFVAAADAVKDDHATPDGEAHGAADHAEKPVAAAEAHGGGAADPKAATSIGGPLDRQPAIAMQFAPAMANLIGEFDRPDPEAVKRAVRFDLFLGFGAEARALLRAFAIEHEDKPIWESMARITDGEIDPDPVFQGMQTCDTAAALWAILADPKALVVGQVQKSAILRAFSALPPHLRLHFGPILVDRFLAMGDFGTATVLRDAITRGSPAGSAAVEMMQAAIDRASGSPGASVSRLEAVAAAPGPSNADALAALIVQRAELGQDVTYDQVRTIEDYAKEHEDGADHDRFQQTLVLAYAASGDFNAAFAALPNAPGAGATVWQLLSNSGPDSDLLNHATLESGQEPPRAARGSASLVADRMLKLGFADQAARWLAVANAPPALLAARIAVAQNQPSQALDLVGDLTSPPAIQVRLDALHQLGDDAAIAKLFADLGMTEDHWNAVSRTQDWQSLAASGPDVWKAAAAAVTGAPPAAAPTAAAAETVPPPEGPLAKGQSLVSSSASTRDAITALLNSVKSPDMASQ
jgi:hypothetical protein